MPGRLTWEQWRKEQLLRNPNIERETLAILSRRAAKRKIPLLCDEDVQALIDALKETTYFRTHTLPPGSSDRAVWQHACRQHLIVLTADLDFWSDRAFPLHRSPGVIILRGRTSEQQVEQFSKLLGFWDLPANYARFQRAFLLHSKTKVSDRSMEHKVHDEGDTVVSRFDF